MWSSHNFAWTEEVKLESLLRNHPVSNRTIGIAPLLLVSLAALGDAVVAIERDGQNLITMVTSNHTRLTYAMGTLGLRPLSDDLRMLESWLTSGRRLDRTPERSHDPAAATLESAQLRFATVIKAAHLAWTYVRQPTFIRWLVSISEAFASDETGVAPSALGHTHRRHGGSSDGGSSGTGGNGHHGVPHHWSVHSCGNYSALMQEAYPALAIAQHWQRFKPHADPALQALHNEARLLRDELGAAFNSTSSLPFVFGYGHYNVPRAHGVLMLAWRSHRSTRETCDE